MQALFWGIRVSLFSVQSPRTIKDFLVFYNLHSVKERSGGVGWMLVVTADSQGCQSCRLTAPKSLWRGICVCVFKTTANILPLWKISSKRHFSSVDYSKIFLKENTFLLWWLLVEMHPEADSKVNMYENEQSTVPRAFNTSAEGDTVKYHPPLPPPPHPEYYCSGTHQSSRLPASLPEITEAAAQARWQTPS